MDKVKSERSKRKAARNKIKSLIKRKFLENWNGERIDFSFLLDKENKIWNVSWHVFYPDFEIDHYENVYNDPIVIKFANQIFDKVNNKILNSFERIIETYRPEKYFILTVPYPPMYIATGDKYEEINGKFVKIKEAHILSEEEINERLNKFDDKGKEFILRQIARDKKVLKYYDFVGGSEWPEECWQIKRYSGIRVLGGFKLEAIDEFKPYYLE